MPIAEHVVGKANAGRRIEKMPGHATIRHAIEPALDQAVKDIPCSRHQVRQPAP